MFLEFRDILCYSPRTRCHMFNIECKEQTCIMTH
jgi:hypothetical protein